MEKDSSLGVPMSQAFPWLNRPSKFVRDHLGKAHVGLSPVLILIGGLPALNSQVLFWGFSSMGWSVFQKAGMGGL